ncbi:hypothetical protein [Actinomadura harenae]|uniref:DUF2178 domain-containing protein n=1 Tax=Actinomadura harenae TaxID=2483351 RepID=A0A3M2M317_9ACTN|nr:hypothetical protein [Actinomadura harenae]RMI44031.1 hypothetical protein EBO15_13990 [Actinomadura harenae]
MTSTLAARRTVPGFFLGVGVVSLVAAGVGGHTLLGLGMLAVLALCAFGALMLARRSEAYRALTEEVDERSLHISGRAWAGTGVVLTIANLGGFVGGLASGHNGAPFFWLIGLGAVAYTAFAGIFQQAG